MDAGLLKMFHDGEHFESVFQMPFDEHSDIWDTDRDTLHMNLSHTLDGILPASPHHQPPNDFDCDLEHKNYMNGSHYSVIQQNQIKLEYESDDDEFENRKISITSIESEDLLKCIAPAVEIIPIDPDCEYSSPLSNDRNDDDDSSSSDESDEDDEESDKKSSSSSSSQDEEDAEEEEVLENVNEKTAINLSNNDEICDMRIDFSELASFDKFMSPVKNSLLIKTPEKLANDSSKDEGFLDDDKLDSDIDVKNFDLTKYITEDDCKLPPPTPGRSIKIEKFSPFIKHNTQIPTRRGYKRLTREFIESDSDESIDVETVSERSFSNKNHLVEITDNAQQKNNNLTHINKNDDNINADPTWTPSKTNINANSSVNKGRPATNSKFRNKVRASIPTPPNNISQNRTRILSAGAQLSRNKLMSFVSKANEPLSSSNDHDYCSPTKKSKINNVQRRTIEISPINPYQDRKKPRVGIGLGKGKSLLLNNMVNHSKLSDDEKESNDESPIKHPTMLAQQQIKTENQNLIEIKQEIIKENEIVQIPVKEKRKLNLQEYKKRRENSSQQLNIDINLESLVKKEKIEYISKDCLSEEKQQQTDVKNNVKLNGVIIDEYNTIVKPTNRNVNIHHKPNSEAIFDPILEATKKALRLKKSKMSEPKIKIPAANPLIPLLPLAELTAFSDDKFKATIESEKMEKFETNVNLNYEEIVIVSIGCNTNISLPPNFDMNITNKILNSSSLLSNINDTINKVKCSGENIRISSNSLLSSITNEVLKKTSDSTETNGKPVSIHVQSSPNIGVSPSNYSPGKPETTKTKLSDQCSQTEKNSSSNIAAEHGEDKIIMHLRKDRIKPKNYSTALQTDSLPHFMPLQKLETIKRRLSENHHYNGIASRNRNSSYSSNDDEFNKYSRQNIRRSSNRTPSPSATHRRHISSSRYNYNSRYRESNRSYSPNYRRRTRSPHLKNSRSRSRDHHHIANKHQRPHSRCSTNSISSNSSSRSRYRRRKRSRRHSSSSSCSSYSSRSRSRGSSVARRSRSRSTIDRQTSPEERRIVYVGRIEKETTKEDIKTKFLTYGPIKQITFHHKDTGMKYGFVTYERAQDAFKAIDSGGRDPEISMYDISFGGRRAFCRNFYSDLDCASSIVSGNNGIPATNVSTTNHSTKSVAQKGDDSFEALLQKVKEKMGAKKPTIKT